jgi:hypothetical protein
MMKTLTQIAVECGAHVQPCKTTYPRHEEIAFDNERELQTFVDAVNKQKESPFEMFENRLNQIEQNSKLKIHVPRTHGKSSLALFDAGWRARDVEIESLRQQLAKCVSALETCRLNEWGYQTYHKGKVKEALEKVKAK